MSSTVPVCEGFAMPTVPSRRTRRATLGVALAAALATLVPAAPAVAEAEHRGSFDVVFRGIVAGRATFHANENTRSYALAGRLQSTGLLRVIADIRYDAQVQGTRAGDRFAPRQYREEARISQRTQEAEMVWRRGIPVVELVAPPKDPEPTDLDPATQRGTVDPLTALWAVLRDVPPGEACDVSNDVFDGRRRSRLRLHSPAKNGDAVVCTGEYRRVAGFADWEMKERVSFPFSVRMEPNGDGLLRVSEVTVDSTYGPVRLVRR
jgi:hypothetical protein